MPNTAASNPVPSGAGAPGAPPAGGESPKAKAPAPAAAPSAVEKVLPEDAVAILGQRIFDDQGATIGRLIDVLVDARGQPVAAVIDFGGFMGVGNRRVAVHWSVLQFNPGDAIKKVVLNMTQDQIKAAPAYRNPEQPAPVVTPAATPAVTSPSSP